MLKRLTMVFLAAVGLTTSQSVANDPNVVDEKPRDSPAFTVVRAHALGLWYSDGAGEIQPGRDTVMIDSAVAPGVSVEMNHRFAGRGFGLGLGTRLSRVTFSFETAVYGGVPPRGWIYSSSATYTLIEPFIGVELGPSGGIPRSHRFSAQVGYHYLENSDNYPGTLSGVSIAFEFGMCPGANGRAGSLLDLSVRGSAVLPQGDRDDVMFLVSFGIGINHRFR